MRLIDADALKRKAQKVATEAWKMKIKADVELTLNQFIDWINDAPTAEVADGWISVHDRLPEVGKVVLAFGTRSATTGQFKGIMANRPDTWMWKNHTPKHVSHWMPLPPAPKGEYQ